MTRSIKVIDFERHRETCASCKPWTVCAEGHRILQQAVDAMNSVDAKKRGQT